MQDNQPKSTNNAIGGKNYWESVRIASIDVTAHTMESPDDFWDEWKETVPRSYDRLGDRINELIALDLLARREHRMGIVEYLDSEGVIDEDEVHALLDEMTKDDQGDTEDGGNEDNA